MCIFGYKERLSRENRAAGDARPGAQLSPTKKTKNVETETRRRGVGAVSDQRRDQRPPLSPPIFGARRPFRREPLRVPRIWVLTYWRIGKMGANQRANRRRPSRLPIPTGCTFAADGFDGAITARIADTAGRWIRRRDRPPSTSDGGAHVPPLLLSAISAVAARALGLPPPNNY